VRVFINIIALAACLFLACLFLACKPPHAVAQTSADDEKDVAEVHARIEVEREHLRTKNFELADEPVVELLDAGKAEPYQLEPTAKTTYALLATCQQACTHIVLSLRDKQGEVLVESPERHHTVIVTGTPEESGTYTAEVTVVSCEHEQCYAGIAVFYLKNTLWEGPSPSAAVLHVAHTCRAAASETYAH